MEYHECELINASEITYQRNWDVSLLQWEIVSLKRLKQIIAIIACVVKLRVRPPGWSAGVIWEVELGLLGELREHLFSELYYLENYHGL